MNQEKADLAISTFRYAPEPLLAAAGVLFWNQPKPSCQLTPGVELSCIADGCDKGRGRDRPDTRDRLKPATCLISAMPGHQFFLMAKNLCLNHLQLTDQ